jgi:hypothetical protein
MDQNPNPYKHPNTHQKQISTHKKTYLYMQLVKKSANATHLSEKWFRTGFVVFFGWGDWRVIIARLLRFFFLLLSGVRRGAGQVQKVGFWGEERRGFWWAMMIYACGFVGFFLSFWGFFVF